MSKQKLQLFAALFGLVLICFPFDPKGTFDRSAGAANASFTLNGFPSAYTFRRPKDNPALPKTRGLTEVLKTESEDLIITNVRTTTFKTLTIQGIPCAIIENLEWTYVKKLKRTFLTAEIYNFYAWDNKGNVWEFGQDSFIYLYKKNWRRAGLSTKGTWLAGKDGAIPRIIVPADSKA
jgi:hypothetical protein